jgi:Fe-S cluster assembly protein SufD
LNLATAIRARDATALPSRRDEDWRWTDLRGLIREVPAASLALDPDSLGEGPWAIADVVLVANGHGPAEIIVPAGGQRAIALRIVSRGDGSHAARLSIRLGEGAKLRLFESHEGEGGYLSHTALEITLANGAAMERLVLSDEAPDSVAVVHAEVTLGAGAEYGQTVLTAGARRQRFETRVLHPGAKTTVKLDAVYLLGGKRHADLTSVVTHEGPDGQTNQLARGVVRDQARAVFQGRIVVAEGADETDARMGHHALILSDRAEVNAKPELEIYADAVSCAHGNTIGALDEQALFYIRQRGVPEVEARAMLTEAFVGEVIDRIWNENARERVRAWVAGRLT